MRIKTVKLDDQTRDILLRSRITDNFLELPEQLERSEYVKVAKAIEAAGGKWDKKARMHRFPEPVRNCLDIDENTVVVIDQQQTFQAFYTPEPIANEVARLAQIEGWHSILEPSAGLGALCHAAVRWGAKWTRISAIEANPRSVNALEINGFKQLVCADFLTCRPGVNKFDRILMNPPFSMGDDIKHVRHAMDFLKKDGRLVSIVGAGPKQHHAFKKGHFPWSAEWIDLPAGTFKESGTEVATAIIIIDR